MDQTKICGMTPCDNKCLSSDVRVVSKHIKDFFCDWIMDYYSRFDYGYCGLFKNVQSSLYKTDIAKVLLEADGIVSPNFILKHLGIFHGGAAWITTNDTY